MVFEVDARGERDTGLSPGYPISSLPTMAIPWPVGLWFRPSGHWSRRYRGRLSHTPWYASFSPFRERSFAANLAFAGAIVWPGTLEVRRFRRRSQLLVELGWLQRVQPAARRTFAVDSSDALRERWRHQVLCTSANVRKCGRTNDSSSDNNV